jgi:hypothetical protein
MKLAESKLDTIKHIEKVRKYIKLFTDALTQRGIDHDKSKLESPEAEEFASVNDKLAKLTYGSEDYNKCIKEELKVALDAHYAKNRHHPEHFPNGIDDMNLVDILEMFADWKASSERQDNGNLLATIKENANRFNIDDQLKHIFINTAKYIDEHNATKGE